MGGSGWNPNPARDLPSDSRSPAEGTLPRLPDRILVVEDNEADVFLIAEAIAATHLNLAIDVVRDGDQAIRFFDRAEAVAEIPCPALVLLDVNLPRRSGDEVLRHLRSGEKCGKARVIAVSTSDSEIDRRKMAESGADGYFRKPSGYAEFMKLGDIIKSELTRPS